MKHHNAKCSFCRKTSLHLGPLVEGPDAVYICGECAELCQSIVEQENRRRNPSPQTDPSAAGPGVVRESLDRLVHGQHEAKEALALAASYRHEGRGRVLFVGPSRSSRLFLARALAHVLQVPFAAKTSADLTEAWAATQEMPSLIYDLLRASGFDLEAARRGVVYVDEVECREAREALLRLWQENVSVAIGQLRFDPRDVLFVCGGMFSELEEAVSRLGRHPEQPVTREALEAAGAHPHWAGHLTAIARVPALDEESLARIVQWVDFSRAD